MKLYVSGPMTGLAEHNFPAFRAATANLRDAGYDVACPTENEHEIPPGSPWEVYLRRDLADVLACSGLALLDGWWRSRGAHLEVHVARALAMPVEPVEHWLAERSEA